MGRSDLERLSKEELIELVLRLQRPQKTSRTSSKPPSTDRKEQRERSKPGGAKPGHEGHSRILGATPDEVGERRPGQAFAGYLADPEPAARGFSSPAGTHPARRRARPLEPDDHGSRGIQRHGDGEHDPGSRLAVSGRRPASGAFVQLDEPGPWRARGRPRRHAGAAA